MFDQGLVFIGGIAVFTHCVNNEATESLAESTYDGDFYISLADMSDLRDIEEVTPNRRLNKSQLIKSGFEFDIYTEKLSALIVPFDEVMANSVTYGTMRVACVEHLIALKFEAFQDRRASSKGAKDARDLIRLATLAEQIGFNPQKIAPYISEEHLALFGQLRKSSEAVALAGGNAVKVKKFRSSVEKLLSSIESTANEINSNELEQSQEHRFLDRES